MANGLVASQREGQARLQVLDKRGPLPADDAVRLVAQVLAAPPDTASAALTATSTLTGRHDDPRAFLMSVMNDPSAPLALRIEAAKGLLQAQGR